MYLNCHYQHTEEQFATCVFVFITNSYIIYMYVKFLKGKKEEPYHLRTAGGAGLELDAFPVRSLGPLAALYVLDDEIAVAAHANHLLAGGTVSRVTGQQTGVTAALWPGLLTS